MRDHLLTGIFYPKPEQIFRSLLSCSYPETRVVLLTTDLATTTYTGLPFSRMEKGSLATSKFFDGMKEDLHTGDFMAFNPSLNYLPERHILLLNTTLTTCQNNDEMELHKGLWRPFITKVIQSINEKEKLPVCFLLVGEAAHLYEDEIDELTHAIYKCECPGDAVADDRKWNHDHIFSLAKDHVRKYYSQDKLW